MTREVKLAAFAYTQWAENKSALTAEEAEKEFGWTPSRAELATANEMAQRLHEEIARRIGPLAAPPAPEAK